MTREQIIEILRDYNLLTHIESLIESITDEILALPLDAPSDEEINEVAMDYCTIQGEPDGEPEHDPEAYRQFRDGMNWMRENILKRNTK